MGTGEAKSFPLTRKHHVPDYLRKLNKSKAIEDPVRFITES